MQDWFIYILECSDGTYYTGITTDIARRLDEHNKGRLGAKYTRARRPVRLVYHEQCENRSAASKSEHQIRQLSREQKKRLIASYIQTG